jgi:hypothetical protein
VTLGQNLLKVYLGIGVFLFVAFVVYVEITDRWREGKMLPLSERIWFTVSRMFWRMLLFVAGVEFWLHISKWWKI